MARDWRTWHLAYDDPTSALTRRLEAVVHALRTALENAPPGPVKLISLCAGDGRDVAGALIDHPRRDDVIGCLLELDPHLAEAAATNLRSIGSHLAARCADAGDPATFSDVVPADVLVLAGIFGNISDADVERLISTVPALCRHGATIVWTRHRRAPDLTPEIRRWFADASCEPVTLESPAPTGFAVGSDRFCGTRAVAPLPTPLFTFRDDLW